MLASADVLNNNAFLFWSAVTLICVVPSICHYWYKVRRHEIDAELKAAMIDRGMSADEIIRVLEAGNTSPTADRSEKPDAVTA
jgi:hypothetical protein